MSEVMDSDVLKYIGWDGLVENELLEANKPLFNISRSYDNSALYKIYKRVKIKDIDILISDSDRTTDIQERYDNAKPINQYIKENGHEFMNIVDQARVNGVKKIEKMQNEYNDKIPYFIKYDKNYLWQIYYSKEENRYFMLFPAREGENSALFYLIKKKLENSDESIYVPICKGDYSEKLFNIKEINDLENYMWLFTKDWPNVYEVENEIYIIGNVKEKGKFNSKYRIKIANKNEAESFFTLLKALFIITTESNYRYSFEPVVNGDGEIAFLFDGKEIKTADLANFIKEQTGKMNDEHDKLIEKTNENKEKLLKEREEISKLNEIYLNQEKQIAMFLNCRKSFFKKLRYYFTDTKHEKKSFKSKKKPAKDDGKQELEERVERTLNNSISAYKPATSAYTISDLMKACSETNSAEEEYINSQSDLNAAILKHKNMKLKVHNADKYLEEIEEHKKSIFEFWKFTNKDELPALKEGETIQKDKKIKAVFNYDEDIIELGEKADRLQRQKLSNDECNSICASLQIVNSINGIMDNKEELLKQDLKRLQDEYTGDIKTEIFGEIKDDYTVVKKLNNKQHRENKRNIYSILRINSKTTIEDYRNTIEDYARLLNESYNKIVAITDFPVYYLKSKETRENDYIIADINPDNIINIAQSGDTIVKRNIRKDEHIIYASNIVFYDNYNKTLPVGMNVSTLVIIKDEEKKQKCSNINIVEENDEFSIKIKKLNIIELE